MVIRQRFYSKEELAQPGAQKYESQVRSQISGPKIDGMKLLLQRADKN
jgi:hypothetical protein